MMAAWPSGTSRMAARIRAHDWSATPLGPVESWRPELRWATDQMLDSAFPAALVWGAELTLLHNDGFLAILGDKPEALGRSFAAVWAEAWPVIAPLVERAMAGQSTFIQDYPLLVERGGGMEQAWFTFAYSPVRDAEGRVLGMIDTVVETTRANRALERLRASDDRFRAFVKASAEVVYRINPDWSEMWQLDGRDFLSDTRDPDACWLERYIHPDDRATVNAAIDAAIAGRSTFALEHRVIRRDGTIGWTSSRAVPVMDEQGRIREWLGTASDVTEQVEARQAARDRRDRHRHDLEREVRERTAELEGSRDLLKGTMDASTDMIQVFEAIRDARGEIVDFHWILNNETSASRFGEVRGESLLERNPGVVQEGIFDTFREVAERGGVIQREHHYTHEQFDGWFLQTVVKLNDGVVTTTKDISEWKATQEELLRLRDEAAKVELRASEERLALIFQEASVGLSEVDADGRFVQVNGELCHILGRPREVLLGKGVREVTHPADIAVSETALRRTATTGRASALDKRYVRPDGSIVWANSCISLLRNPDGRPPSFLVVTADLTARHRTEAALRDSEKRFQQFGAASSDALWIRDVRTLCFEYVSPAFEQIVGQPFGGDLALDGLRRWLRLIVPSDRRTALAGMRRVRQGERAVSDFRILHADGHVRWVRDTSFPLIGEDGAVGRIGGIMEDVTESRESSERLEMLVGELQHRTRNLIAVVRSIAERTMLRATTLADFHDNFHDRLEALSRVQGLLSRLGDHDRVYFDELLRSELEALGVPQEGADRVTLDGPAGVRLRSSTVQIVAMALHELGTNAAKYGALHQPGGRLAITWWHEPQGEGGQPWLHLDWRESGVAMPAPGAAPQGTGQGRELIERALPYQLKAQTCYVQRRDGVHCTIAIPVSASNGR